MPGKKQNRKWTVVKELKRVSTPWLTLIGERLNDNNNHQLDYWRVEKPNGILVIVVQNNQILLPKPFYRPGIGRYTLDLPGGRQINPKNKIINDARDIVKRELGIEGLNPLIDIKALNKTGWNLDSSFSNVQLYFFIARLGPLVKANNLYTKKRYSADKKGIKRLLGDINCSQCRLALLQWQTSIL